VKRMRCAQADPLFDRYVDGVLPAGNAASLEAHLADCAACRERLADARSIARALAADHRVKAPKGFAAAVMDEVFRARPERQSVREALGGRQARDAIPSRAAVPTRIYRRLGLSIVLSAGVLGAVLVTQPRLMPGRRSGETAPFAREGSGVVRAILDGADQVVERALRSAGGPAAGMTKGEVR